MSFQYYVLVVSLIVGFAKGQGPNDILYTNVPAPPTTTRDPLAEPELFTSPPLAVESNELPDPVALQTNSSLTNSTAESEVSTSAPVSQSDVPARFETTSTTTNAPIYFGDPSSTTEAQIIFETPSTTTSAPIYFGDPSSTTEAHIIFEDPSSTSDAHIAFENPTTTASPPIHYETPSTPVQHHFEAVDTSSQVPISHPQPELETRRPTANIPVYSQTPSYPPKPPTTINPLLQLAIDSILPSQRLCGYQNERIPTLNDPSLADIDEFPWVALLRYRYSFGFDAGFRCAGTLISRQYVLTAARCVLTQKKLLELETVRLGEWKLSSSHDCIISNNRKECAKKFLEVGVAKTIVHPNHNCDYGNDNVALVRLKKIVDFSDTIRPICLPNINLKSPCGGKLFITSGWGATQWGHLTDIKTKTELPVLTDMECAKRLKPNMYVFKNEVCVGTNFHHNKICSPDDGAPVMNANRNGRPQWYLEGVISGGYGFGKNGIPDLYTRVTDYVEWILTSMAEDSLNVV